MSHHNFPNLRVLIGEDYDIIRDLLEEIFNIFHVKRVDIVADGAQAVEHACANEYDLLLLDINMPEKDGYEVALDRKLFQGTPLIVALSAGNIEEIKPRGLAVGMDDFLSKPVQVEDIEALLIKHFPNEAVPSS